MADLQRSGKVRALGVSNYAPSQMDQWITKAALSAAQPPYNIFEREAEQEFSPGASATGWRR